MAEQLSQSQIDALLQKMSSGSVAVEDDTPKAKEYDFKSPKKFTKEQLKTLDGLHETFSRVLAPYLSGMLRTSCEVQVVQIEEQRYFEYNNALPDNALIGMTSFRPKGDYSEATLMVDFSTSLGFYLIDRLLGGSGETYNLTRDYTEIELAILHNVIGKIIEKLGDTWNNYLELESELTSIETNSRLLQVFAPEDVVVIVIMDIKIGPLASTMSICIPAENLEEVIDKFSVRYTRGNKRFDPDKEQARKELILQTVCDTDLKINAIFDTFQMDLKDILQLQPEDIIPLTKGIHEDVSVMLDGLPWFSAKLGEVKKKKAIKLNKVIE